MSGRSQLDLADLAELLARPRDIAQREQRRGHVESRAKRGPRQRVCEIPRRRSAAREVGPGLRRRAVVDGQPGRHRVNERRDGLHSSWRHAWPRGRGARSPPPARDRRARRRGGAEHERDARLPTGVGGGAGGFHGVGERAVGRVRSRSAPFGDAEQQSAPAAHRAPWRQPLDGDPASSSIARCALAAEQRPRRRGPPDEDPRRAPGAARRGSRRRCSAPRVRRRRASRRRSPRQRPGRDGGEIARALHLEEPRADRLDATGAEGTPDRRRQHPRDPRRVAGGERAASASSPSPLPRTTRPLAVWPAAMSAGSP